MIRWDHGSVGPHAEVKPGSLLVAAPQLMDDNFQRTVIYIIRHEGEGTLGVVLNRPSEVEIGAVLPQWAPHATQPQSLFVGGPVDQRAAICLTTLRAGVPISEAPGVMSVQGPVGLVDLESDPSTVVSHAKGLRVFAGYSGWSADQLSSEIERGDWYVVPGLPDDVIGDAEVDLWGQVLRRQGPPLAFVATHPGDVQLN